MTLRAIVGARILSGESWLDNHGVVMADGIIQAVMPAHAIPADAALHVLSGGTLLPGFIDTQVNGGGGVLFNDVPTVDGITTIAAAHRRFGTTAMLPTLISDDLDVIAAAIAAVDQAIETGIPGRIMKFLPKSSSELSTPRSALSLSRPKITPASQCRLLRMPVTTVPCTEGPIPRVFWPA